MVRVLGFIFVLSGQEKLSTCFVVHDLDLKSTLFRRSWKTVIIGRPCICQLLSVFSIQMPNSLTMIVARYDFMLMEMHIHIRTTRRQSPAILSLTSLLTVHVIVKICMYQKFKNIHSNDDDWGVNKS